VTERSGVSEEEIGKITGKKKRYYLLKNRRLGAK